MTALEPPARRSAELREVLHEVVTIREREARIQRRFGATVVVSVAGFALLIGILLAAGGEQRLTSPFFTGPARVVPGWPWTWASIIGGSGVLLAFGYLTQRFTPGILGAVGITAWSWSFAALSWLSIADEEVGHKVAWYPTPVYGLIGTVAACVAVLLFALRRLARADAG